LNLCGESGAVMIRRDEFDFVGAVNTQTSLQRAGDLGLLEGGVMAHDRRGVEMAQDGLIAPRRCGSRAAGLIAAVLDPLERGA
jgi:hypothetical protein